MRAASNVFPESTNASQLEVLVLKHGERRILVEVPKTYEELANAARDLFTFDRDTDLSFSTTDLDICQQHAVEIHPGIWQAVRFTLSSVSVKTRAATGRDEERRSSQIKAGPSTSKPLSKAAVNVPASSRSATLQDDDEMHVDDEHQRPPSARVPAPSSSTTAATETRPTSGTSFDEYMVNVPMDDLFGDDLDDEHNEAYASPTKGKGRVRQRIESDGEEDPVDSAPAPRSPAPIRNESVPPVNAFSPVRSPGVRASPALSSLSGVPKDDVRDLFSPKTKGPLSRVAAAEEGVSASPKPDKTSQARGTPSSSIRYTSTQEPAPTASKFKPAGAAPPPLMDDKLLITIAYPPTGQESKFKVKGKHLVEKVLMSACTAFGLDPARATLMFQIEDEDGMEMSYPLEKQEGMVTAGAKNGSSFVIKLDDDE